MPGDWEAGRSGTPPRGLLQTGPPVEGRASGAGCWYSGVQVALWSADEKALGKGPSRLFTRVLRSRLACTCSSRLCSSVRHRELQIRRYLGTAETGSLTYLKDEAGDYERDKRYSPAERRRH